MDQKFKEILKKWVKDIYRDRSFKESDFENLISDEETINSLGGDSLDTTMLLIDIEDEYKIEIDDEEAEELDIRNMQFKQLNEIVNLRKK